MNTTTLYGPVSTMELKLIENSGWKAFPSRLPDLLIFYPILDEKCAIQIARGWHLSSSVLGFITRFEVDTNYLSHFKGQVFDGVVDRELWVPDEELEEFNRHIVGQIEVAQQIGTPFRGHAETWYP